jgi:ABC-type multidrug transport system ATPase subunit
MNSVGGKIFVSYRHLDSEGEAGRLYEHLSRHFGRDRIFMDVEDIRPGEDFVVKLKSAISQSAVLLAIIGPEWLSITGEDGNPRIHNDGDYVRKELELAIKYQKKVMPITIRGARMVSANKVPASLEKFASIQATDLRHKNFELDAKAIILLLEQWFTTQSYDATNPNHVVNSSPLRYPVDIPTSISTLRCEDITKTYSVAGMNIVALDNLTVSLEVGSLFAVGGRKDAGKSTLLRILSLLEDPTDGRILLDGIDPMSYKHKQIDRLRTSVIRYVRPEPARFENNTIGWDRSLSRPGVLGLLDHIRPDRTLHLLKRARIQVLDCVLNAMRLHSTISESNIHAYAREILDQFGLQQYAACPISQLSWRDRQRMNFVVAIAAKPSFLIVDGITIGISDGCGVGLIQTLKRLCKETGMGVIFEATSRAQNTEADRFLRLEEGNIATLGLKVGQSWKMVRRI